MAKEITKEDEDKVPKDTFYCYTPTSGFKQLDNGNWGYTIDSCPFYKHIDGLEGHCSLLDCEIMDQVKECGINYGD